MRDQTNLYIAAEIVRRIRNHPEFAAIREEWAIRCRLGSVDAMRDVLGYLFASIRDELPDGDELGSADLLR
jgi:hypothetical protein